jgi:hypothetical protein
MIDSSDFRTKRMPLSHGAGHMPVLGFGTLIPDAAATISAVRDALEAGFRHFECAERYRNEREVGEALQAGLAAGGITREDIGSPREFGQVAVLGGFPDFLKSDIFGVGDGHAAGFQ